MPRLYNQSLQCIVKRIILYISSSTHVALTLQRFWNPWQGGQVTWKPSEGGQVTQLSCLWLFLLLSSIVVNSLPECADVKLVVLVWYNALHAHTIEIYSRNTLRYTWEALAELYKVQTCMADIVWASSGGTVESSCPREDPFLENWLSVQKRNLHFLPAIGWKWNWNETENILLKKGKRVFISLTVGPIQGSQFICKQQKRL